jgi:hypothetical protein
MPPMNDDKPRHQMSDDERATVGEKYRKRRDTDPEKASKPGPLEAFFTRIPTAWKLLTCIAAIFLAGVMGHAYLINYTKKYATHDDLAKHTAKEVELREQIRILRESDATRSADIASIKSDTAAVREDIRTLLQYMLGNPPVRTPAAPGKVKTP